jgi:hypothetical protein
MARASAGFDQRKIVIVVLIASDVVGYVVLSTSTSTSNVALKGRGWLYDRAPKLSSDRQVIGVFFCRNKVTLWITFGKGIYIESEGILSIIR